MNVTLEKGGTTATIHTEELTENRDNSLITSALPQTKQKQENGPKDTRIIDLLRLTVEFIIRGRVDETNKNNLITISNGAGTSGTITMTYDSHPDSPLQVAMSKCMIKKNSQDKNTDKEYEVQLTLIEGSIQ